MFKIKLSPQQIVEYRKISKQGNKLIVNDVEYDFSALMDGGELPVKAIDGEIFVTDDIRRVGDDIHLTLKIPHAYAGYTSTYRRFPPTLEVETDGEIILPLDLGDTLFKAIGMSSGDWLRHVAAVKAKYGRQGVDCGLDVDGGAELYKILCALRKMDYGAENDELYAIIDGLFADFGWTMPPEETAPEAVQNQEGQMITIRNIDRGTSR